MTNHVLLLTHTGSNKTDSNCFFRQSSFTICERLRHLAEEDDGEERCRRNLPISLRAQTKRDD